MLHASNQGTTEFSAKNMLKSYNGMNPNMLKHIGTFILFCLFNFSIFAPRNANADAKEVLDDIISTLSNLTCETQGIGNLLRSEFSHTCLSGAFFSYAVASTMSPGIYTMMLLRLKINDDDLFASKFPKGQCTKPNRADPNNPMITFALCNNIKLAVARAGGIANAAIAIATTILTGSDPWDSIADAWKTDKAKFHDIFENKKDGDIGFAFDVAPGSPIMPWKVIKERDRICVAAPTITFSWVPIGCKYIREPYPESVYANFMNAEAPQQQSTGAIDPMKLTKCGTIGAGNGDETCYQRAYNSSKTAIVMSSPLVECVKEMAARLFFDANVCTYDQANSTMSSSNRQSSSFFKFQKNMRGFVAGCLSLYVMFFGIKLMLGSDDIRSKDVMNFFIKIIFVVYFSIGININSNDDERLDGMTSLAFPMLLNGATELSGWVMNASPSGLCKFNSKDYQSGSAYIALWDALDCRVSHYLGLDILGTLYVENSSRNRNFKDFDLFNFAAPPYVYLLIPAIISGSMTLVSLALMYPLLVISVAAYVVNATVMCIVGISILGILAPLFVPMYLFDYTRGYFEGWAKLMLSFMLQPMVVTTFMIFMFSVYDVGFYGQCKYLGKDISSTITDGGDGKRKVKIFYLNNDWDNYTAEEEKSCKNSLGYILNNPIATLADFTKDNLNDMLTTKPGDRSATDYIARFAFMAYGPAMFFVSPKLLYEKVKDLLLALITACATLYLMYNFSAQLSEFAADMTEGVSLKSVTINPQTIYETGMKALGAMNGAMKGAAAKGASGASDKISAGGGGRDGISNKISNSGGGTAKDTVSKASASGTTKSSIGASARDGLTKVATKVAGSVRSDLELAAKSAPDTISGTSNTESHAKDEVSSTPEQQASQDQLSYSSEPPRSTNQGNRAPDIVTTEQKIDNNKPDVADMEKSKPTKKATDSVVEQKVAQDSINDQSKDK